MAQGETNRRGGPRVAVGLDVQLARKVGNTVTARTLDLSVGGALVVSDRPLRIDEELRFDLELPNGAQRLDGTARVLRQPRHDTFALRFEQIAPAGQRDLSTFVSLMPAGA